MKGYDVIDLSHTLQPGMPETTALPRLGLWWYSRQSWGDAVDCQAILISEHTGTNVDAPRHVIPEGKTIDELPVDSFMGPAVVLDLSHMQPTSVIRPEDIEAAEGRAAGRIEASDIVLLMTGHDDRYWQVTPKAYSEMKRRPVLSLEAAEYLANKRVKAIGVDTTSPDVSGTTLPVHHYLLSKGILIIEGLSNLNMIPGERFLFVALPLKIFRGSGSPVRAVAVTGILE